VDGGGRWVGIGDEVGFVVVRKVQWVSVQAGEDGVCGVRSMGFEKIPRALEAGMLAASISIEGRVNIRSAIVQGGWSHT
jgi:hypothetical protein